MKFGQFDPAAGSRLISGRKGFEKRRISLRQALGQLTEQAQPGVRAFGEDDTDQAAERRAMDRVQQVGAVRNVYGIDAASGRPDDLQLGF